MNKRDPNRVTSERNLESRAIVDSDAEPPLPNQKKIHKVLQTNVLEKLHSYVTKYIQTFNKDRNFFTISTERLYRGSNPVTFGGHFRAIWELPVENASCSINVQFYKSG